jgi:hypothetical protein
MTWKRHGIASLAAVVTFSVLTLLSHSWGVPALTAVALSAGTMTAGYFHYRRKAVRKSVLPVTPVRDDRVIPQDVKVAVCLRDKGECQIQGPPCVGDSDWNFDHKVPHEWGGSSKDPDNIQMACGPCNRWKSNRFADTPGGRVTREEYMRMMAA